MFFNKSITHNFADIQIILFIFPYSRYLSVTDILDSPADVGYSEVYLNK